MPSQIRVTVSGPDKSGKTWVASAIISTLSLYGIDVKFEGLDDTTRTMPIPQRIAVDIQATVIEAHDGEAKGM